VGTGKGRGGPEGKMVVCEQDYRFGLLSRKAFPERIRIL